jgi:hypothetical protein
MSEAFLLIADVSDGHTRQVGKKFWGNRLGSPRFTRQNNAVGGDERFTGNTRIRVGGKERVQNGVADTIRDLVRVALGNRLRGK